MTSYTFQEVAIFYLCIAAGAYFLEEFFLLRKLDDAGEKIKWSSTNTRRYVDELYTEWCDSKSISPQPRMKIRKILKINVGVAVLILIGAIIVRVTS